MQNRKNIHYVILILGAIVAVLFLVLLFLHEKNGIYNQTLMAGATAIPVSIADTDATREQGLSGTASLPITDGKLFVFDQPSSYGFWMKDMSYGLDFVWIDSSMKIVGITPDVAANTYPQIFYPPQPVQYVLEVNAGFATKNNLTIGEQLSL
jgi:uncharacterized membrane protein (UPF0127 family)